MSAFPKHRIVREGANYLYIFYYDSISGEPAGPMLDTLFLPNGQVWGPPKWKVLRPTYALGERSFILNVDFMVTDGKIKPDTVGITTRRKFRIDEIPDIFYSVCWDVTYQLAMGRIDSSHAVETTFNGGASCFGMCYPVELARYRKHHLRLCDDMITRREDYLAGDRTWHLEFVSEQACTTDFHVIIRDESGTPQPVSEALALQATNFLKKRLNVFKWPSEFTHDEHFSQRGHFSPCGRSIRVEIQIVAIWASVQAEKSSEESAEESAEAVHADESSEEESTEVVRAAEDVRATQPARVAQVAQAEDARITQPAPVDESEGTQIDELVRKTMICASEGVDYAIQIVVSALKVKENKQKIKENALKIEGNASKVKENALKIKENALKAASAPTDECCALTDESFALFQESDALIEKNAALAKENDALIEENAAITRETRAMIERLATKA